MQKRWKIALGTVGTAALLAGCLVFAMSRGVFLSKSNQILLAAARTAEQSQLLKDGNPTEIVQDEYTVDVNATINKIAVSAVYAAEKEQKSLNANIGVSFVDDKIKTTLLLKDGILEAQVPLVGNDVFTYSYEDETTGCLTNLFSTEQVEKLDSILEGLSQVQEKQDTTEVKESFTDIFLEEFRSLNFTKTTTKDFVVNGTEKSCKAYQTDLTKECYERFWNRIGTLYDGESRAAAEQMMPYQLLETVKEKTNVVENSKVTFYLGAGQLAAVRIETDDTNIVVELHGTDENKVEQLKIYDETETLLDLKYHDEDGTFKIKSGRYHSGSIAGTLTREEGMCKVAMIEFKWGNKEGAVTVKLTQGATCAAVEQSGDEINLNTMTSDEFKRVFWKIIWMKGGGLT